MYTCRGGIPCIKRTHVFLVGDVLRMLRTHACCSLSCVVPPVTEMGESEVGESEQEWWLGLILRAGCRRGIKKVRCVCVVLNRVEMLCVCVCVLF